MPAMSGALTDVRSAFAELPVPASTLVDARLLVSELVANSMRHARLGPNDTIRVAAEVENGRLRVDEQGKMESITVEPDDLGLFDHVLNAVLRDSEAS